MIVPTFLDIQSDARRLLVRRGAAILFALMIELILLLALLKLGDQGPKQSNDLPTKTFSLNTNSAQPSEQRAAKREQESKTDQQAERPKTQEQKRIVSPQPPDPTTPPIVEMSREEFAAADLSKLPRANATSGGSTGKQGVYGPPGGGPGNAQLFDADWYREPTRGQLAAYFPAGARPGWGLIACQTAPHYRVENCQALSDSPGSGLAQALRRAAWQFQVIPPRINGRPIIGAWVRIRFDLTTEKEHDDRVVSDQSSDDN
jgi:hypothetical protein